MNHANQFEVGLGRRDEIGYVEFNVSEWGVQAKIQRIANNPYTPEQVPYFITSFFPLRSSSGFCSQSTLYYQENGVLSGTSSRSGSGYKLTVTSP